MSQVAAWEQALVVSVIHEQPKPFALNSAIIFQFDFRGHVFCTCPYRPFTEADTRPGGSEEASMPEFGDSAGPAICFADTTGTGSPSRRFSMESVPVLYSR